MACRSCLLTVIRALLGAPDADCQKECACVSCAVQDVWEWDDSSDGWKIVITDGSADGFETATEGNQSDLDCTKMVCTTRRENIQIGPRILLEE